MTDDDIQLPPTSAVTDESSTFLDLGDLAPALPSPSQAELDDVIEGIPCEVVDPTVLAAIARNLGAVPANLVRVAASYTTRQNQVEPAVLVLYPLRDCTNDYKKHHRATAEPFPTMYWLASPELHERVSLLEGAGFVTRFTDRLAASPKHLQVRPACCTVGIAGIRNPASVKCLHTHYAHFLATGHNLVGAWVHQALNQGESATESAGAT
ncbi:hypothetical protein B5M09_011389 [Aphanomyces astaci]|uniref:DUF501 domain-containing protein n=1 Tax=Aphanomyces astaci TaxID=112090 RepID=A0A3R8D3Y1_APHAT|nr:hypothetical protein B5M09_011389 [Aphanomyces astaci]